jgi:GEVED domain
MKKTYFLVLVTTILIGFSTLAQESFPPSQIVEGTFIRKTMRLDEFPEVDQNTVPSVPTMVIDQIVPRAEGANKKPTTVIHNLQTEPGQIKSMPIEQNFIGASQNESGFLPPDPTGAVGPNHYVHSVNSLVKIFSKTGALLVGPVSLSNFLGIASNNGDPVVLYDQLADRWFVSEFGNLGANLGLAIGVSETNDPAGAYNVYQFDLGGFPDYPHYGVWHDGYYGTANYIGGGQTVAGFVMERAALLAGDPSPKMVLWEDLPGNIGNGNNVRSAQPANFLGTNIDTSLPGYFTYLQDDGWNAAITYDHLKVWEVELDWINTANTTISAPLEIATDPFDSGELFGPGNGAIRQPGTSNRLAGHGGIVSFAANYRAFDTHNSWLITFNTFIDANETGGIRWIELRNDGSSDWSIFQEGTYSIADGHSRVMSSSAMDAEGNIALAYTTASTTLPVSLRYTGRYDGDAPGEMTVAETIIFDGPGVRTNNNRYGDYSHMTMDPDNFTFWYTGDYFASNNFWQTRVASWRIFGPFADDVGVNGIISPTNGVLTNAEVVEVSIRNYSPDPVSNIPVELRVDGNLVATETFGGTINSNETATFQFAQTVDLSTAGQTYSIEAKTTLAGDGYNPNNDYTKEVSHLFSNDVGVEAILTPFTSSGLGNETVTVKVRNFGGAPQSGFDVQYTVNGGTPVTQSFAGTLASEEAQNFSFSQTADLSAGGIYTIASKTLLNGDQLPANDEAVSVVQSIECQPTSNCTVGHGFRLFEVGGISNASGCESDGYGDFTQFVANLEPDSTNELTVSSEYGEQYISVWIDFNDDLSFTSDELVVDNYHFAPGQGGGTYTETMDLVVPVDAAIGEHRMRARANGTGPVPNDSCELIVIGETEDYTANIGFLGINDYVINDSNLIIVSHENNQFEIILETDYDEGVFMAVYNMLGQGLGFNKGVPKIDGAYRVNLNMNNAASGTYIIRMGGHSTTTYKSGKIIVK